jgi:hypothetical protein
VRRGADDVTALLEAEGVLLQSARGPVANVAELVAGEPIRGSWWGHPAAHDIFAVLEQVTDSPDVVRCRLVQGKVALVHRRVWPALVRVADRFPPHALARVVEEHTPSGAHRTTHVPFPAWVPADVVAAGHRLDEEAALAQLPAYLRDAPPARRHRRPTAVPPR